MGVPSVSRAEPLSEVAGQIEVQQQQEHIDARILNRVPISCAQIASEGGLVKGETWWETAQIVDEFRLFALLVIASQGGILT